MLNLVVLKSPHLLTRQRLRRPWPAHLVHIIQPLHHHGSSVRPQLHNFFSVVGKAVLTTTNQQQRFILANSPSLGLAK